MSLHQAAKHLASKGRNGDTTLVHMTKGEVAGLQALAKRHGTSLTINPHTGLPEAFGLKALLPIAAGIALGPAGFGIASSAMGAGLMVGGATALATGSLKEGLVAGLGAYGGAGLAGSGAAATTEAGTQAMAGEGATAGSATANQAPVFETTATPVETIQAGGQAAPATQQYAGAYQPTSFSSAPADLATETQAYSATPTNYGAFGEAPAPVDSGTTVADATQQQASASYGTAQPVSSTTPPPSGTFERVAANAEANPKYIGAAAAPALAEDMAPKPYNPPERKVDADMGQRLAFEPGYDNEVPGRTGPASYTQISGEEAKKLYGFADGGDVQFPYGESVMRMANGGSTGYEAGGRNGDYSGYGSDGPNGDYSGYGLGGLSGNYTGYDTAPNQGIAAVVSRGNPNQRIVDMYARVEADRIAAEAKAAEEARIAEAISNSIDPSFNFFGSGGDGGGTYAAGGGVSSLGSYSDGGRMLKGPGDGMSDNIPATIGGKQPARLADGEFVVPADVVSHLGNGSTDAGAKQLYKMMDKIRQARTGRKAQGKQINPKKYLPA